MAKFEETGEFDMVRGREQKLISNKITKEVALAVAERVSGSQYFSRNV